ncbi:MAG: metalloregulator ArsR/SmtB family transcription factor [Caldicoprobacter oshimai]|uniref:Transcriptional regulator, ArsR family n=1 Tax=Caldicoprobacter faecalis TaxID=937334 RepID=A0A1I5VZ21_9FIRM|nr:metalloregulator ArsR/SmtB family transcription factor [Caldicoprobacter faecalis]PZN11955.1 MAG: ArsR family transcriptional regulator [Caldicoprobacter oshimai]SFQ12715.1 transcriptional regulator, ArsR family [Caldicoprobacter faecalis]
MDVSKYQQKAELLKTLGHPVRLCIVHGLMHNACNVSGIQQCLKLPQSTISQHLGILKSRGIIKGERRGVEVKYSVIHGDAIKVVKVLLDEEDLFSTGVKEE